MGFFGKPRSGQTPAHVLEAERRSAALVELEGELACTDPVCAKATGLACEYVDRRGRSCRTAWCPDHRLIIDARVYCRRHAGVVSALPGGHVSNAAPMPDLENRAPSLVSWVAREVDADIRQMLLSQLGGHSGAQLLTDPVYLIFTGSDRRRAWERAWKLVDHGGHTLRVSLFVEEDAEAEVAVKVNSTIVDRLVPPWIVQRLHGVTPSPELDSQRRKDFNRRLLDTVAHAVAREQSLARQIGENRPPAAGEPHN